MTKLGELLKSEREKRGLSLHEIGMSLKINPKILTAIEEGDQPNFPAKTFLRGFVKSYAQYLRLDLNEVMQMFQDEYGGLRIEEPVKAVPPPGATPAPQTPVGPPKYETSLKRPDDSALPVSNNNRIYTILFAILLLTLIAFVAKMMDKYQKESNIEVTETEKENNTNGEESNLPTTTTLATSAVAPGMMSTPVDGGLTPIDSAATTTTTLATGPTTTTVPSVTTTTLKGALVAPVSTTTTTSTSTTLRAVSTTTTTMKPVVTTTTTSTTLRPVVTTTTLRPAVTTTTLRSVPTTTLRPGVTTTTLSAAAAATTAVTTTTSLTTLTTIKSSTEVIVEALSRVTIRFTLNGGKKWETLDLNPDQVHTFRSRAGIQLEVSDGGGVNVIVNGRDRGAPGIIGKPLKLNFP